MSTTYDHTAPTTDADPWVQGPVVLDGEPPQRSGAARRALSIAGTVLAATSLVLVAAAAAVSGLVSTPSAQRGVGGSRTPWC
jgi:hypothetical protein